jgi:hypothetical protein
MRRPTSLRGWLFKKSRPRWWINTLAILCAIDFVLIGAAVVTRFYQTGLHFSIAELGPLMLGAGVLVALITLLTNKQREASNDFLKSAIDLLSKSYEVLAQKNPDAPANNLRLNWLTSARLLSSAEIISNSITEESHIRIWKNECEYWRSRFRDHILSSTDFPQPDYFEEKSEHLNGRKDGGDHSSPNSLATLYRFIHWPENE